MTAHYLRALVDAHPSIREIWLFGSRANGRARPESDWDYMVFSDDDRLLNCLHLDTQFDRPDIDLFIVAAPMVAMKPWAGERQKMLRLDDEPGNLNWKVISATEVEYVETKGRGQPDLADIAVDIRQARAELVYRRA